MTATHRASLFIALCAAMMVLRLSAQSAAPPPPLTLGVQPPPGLSGRSLVVDRERNVYYAGVSSDPAFPTTEGAYSRRCGVDGQCGRQFFGLRLPDVVVVKMGADGTLKRSTFLGGDAQLGPSLIQLGPDGSVYVAGGFQELPFVGPQRMPFANPSVPGCGENDLFLARLDPNSFSLIYWTCIQGPFRRAPIHLDGLAVDQTGSAIVVGSVVNPQFPLVGAFQPVNRAGINGFIKKLLPDGRVAFSTQFSSLPNSVAVDRQNNIYVAGSAASNLPVSRAFQPFMNGNGDGFLSKFDPDGRTLLFSTHLGGSGSDMIWGVAIDSHGNAWVVGDTHSTDFPTTVDAQRPASPCGRDMSCSDRNPSAFAAKFDDLGRLRYSTLIGPANINPASPGAAGIRDIRIGPRDELELFGVSTPNIEPVRGLAAPSCSLICGFLMTIGPLGDTRFASSVPSGRGSTLPYSSRGSWTLGPEGEIYVFRDTSTFASEMVVIWANQLDVTTPLR